MTLSAWLLHASLIAACLVGLVASRTMHAKAEADLRGRLAEPSVVQSPRARLFGGVDNAAIGLVYYPAVAIASFLFANPFVQIATLIAAVAAAAMSVYLLYSLFFVTRMKCSNCVLAHAMNLSILGLVFYLNAVTST